MRFPLPALSALSLALCVTPACLAPEAPDTEPDRGLHASERAAAELPRESPAPRWSGDPREDQAQAARDAADTAAERDGDELVSRMRPASTGGPGTASACDGDPLGSFDYCSVDCVCDASEGDCDADDECATGLVCMRDTGALFGFDPELDVCMEQCDPDALGTPDFCSTDCPCEHAQADCDEDHDCAAGNVCAKNVGASFGFAADVDVCVDACDPILNGDYDFCSAACLCEHGQGDCDRDSDCAPGHVCAHNVGADFGFPDNMDVCVAIEVPHESFAGHVIDAGGSAVSGATVSINQVAFVTGSDGAFSMSVEASDRYVINVEKFGYVPHSSIHAGAGLDDMFVTIDRAQMLALTPETTDIEDDTGTRIALSAPVQEALVDENGEPPKESVMLQMHTFDVVEEGMVGDMEAIDASGNLVALQSVGAVSADFVGISGTKYQLAPGQSAQIAMEIPPEIDYSGEIPLWYYDMEQGRWIEEGEGFVQDRVAFATVSHFSAWNFDVKFVDPACIKVTASPTLGNSIDARVVVPPSSGFPRSQIVKFENGDNVLYNLPANTEIEIFVPPDATAPTMTVNSRAPWGGIGEPANYDSCNGSATLPTLNGQIRGSAALQARTDHTGINIRVLRSSDQVQEATAKTDSNGRYRVENIRPQTYNIEFSRPGYLTVLMDGVGDFFEAVTVIAGKVHYLPCIRLLAGDVNEDGRIDQLDEDEILARIGPAVPKNPDNPDDPGDLADINDDGEINTADLAIVRENRDGQVIQGPLEAGDANSQCPSGNVAQVTAGGFHTCTLMTDGRARCWGRNALGQLGYGDPKSIGDDDTLITVADRNSMDAAVTQLAIGGYHSCAIVKDSAGNNQARCWGYNSAGQLGYATTNNIGDDEASTSISNITLGFTGADPVVQISTGLFHTCARSTSGRVRCWGDNTYGQLGYGDTDNVGDDETPDSKDDVNVGANVIQIVSGGFHTCALLSNQKDVKCWGSNQFGQLGYGHKNNIGDDETPASVGSIDLTSESESVEKLVAGYNHTCAILSTGTLRCWGDGSHGQLGYGSTENIGDDAEETPRQQNVPVGSLGDRVAEVVTGGFHTCARISATNKVYCWGAAEFGQLGYGNTDTLTAPSGDSVQLSDDVIELSAGLYHTCAILVSGSVQCWGRANVGQLGYGDINDIGDNELPTAAGSVPFLE